MNGDCWYLIISATVCTAVSLLELLDRYSYAARFRDVVQNIPGFIYLTLNFVVGAIAVPIAKNSGLVDIATVDGEIVLSSALKSVLIGFGALGVLRSSFANLGGQDGSNALGFGTFLDRLKAYLDRKIAIQHKMTLDTEIAPAMKDIPEARLQFDLPTICVAGIKCSQSEIDDVKAVAVAAFQQPLSSSVRKLLVGHAICQLCGIDVLKASIKQILEMEKNSVPLHGTVEADLLASSLQAERDRLIAKENPK
ncbi:MAG: hypothetical protein WAW73_03285 [Rhodoferax sp.]